MTPIYRTLLGDDYQHLPQPVQDLHNLTRHAVWRGTACVQRGRGAGWLLGAVMGMPPAGENIPVTVTFTRSGEKEIWQRNFGGHKFQTHQWYQDGFLHETIGIGGKLIFRVTSNENGISLETVDIQQFGISVMRMLRPRICARETAEGNKFCFDVSFACWPFGFVISYKGSLLPVI